MKSKYTLYQLNTINSLVNKVYEGFKHIEEILENGSYGLGTTDQAYGELIYLDGKAYIANELCQTREIIGNDFTTPFSVVANIGEKREELFFINKDMNYSELEKYLLKKLELKNYPSLIIIKANFEDIKIRSLSPQPKPYTNLSNSLNKVQKIRDLGTKKGTLVGFWFPEHLSDINVPGFHFHFIDEQKMFGGHILDFKIKESFRIKFRMIDNINIDLATNYNFSTATITNNKKEIEKIEKIR